MPLTTWPAVMATLTELQRPRIGTPIDRNNMERLAVWRSSPPDWWNGTWHVCVNIDVDVDSQNGTPTAVFQLRTSDGTISNPAVIDGPTSRLILGFMPVSDSTTSVTLEGKTESSGAGGSVSLKRASAMLLSSPPAAQIGGPSYPDGYTPPDLARSWTMGSGSPVAGVWTERNLGYENLALSGTPVVNANVGITLDSTEQITGSGMAEPDDVFDIEMRANYPTSTAGQVLFSTKNGAATAAVDGVAIVFTDNAGTAQLVDSDGNTSPTFTIPLGATSFIRLEKLLTKYEVRIDGGYALTNYNRPATDPAGTAFTINGNPGGSNAGDVTVTTVYVREGFGVATPPVATGPQAPPAVLIPTANLVVDISASDLTSWGNNRAADGGQWIVAGNRFNPGLNDNSGGTGTGYGLTWDNNNQISSWAMENGETRRLWADTHNGVPVIATATQFIQDGSYTYQSGAQNTALNIGPGLSDALYFDGTRNQLAMLAKQTSIGLPNGVVRVAFSFVIEEDHFADGFRTGPYELHAPTNISSPLLFSIRNGLIYASGKYSSTPIQVSPAVNPPTNLDIATVSLGTTADVGKWSTHIIEYRIDPDNTGFLNWYTVDDQGFPNLVVQYGSGFGYIYDTTDPAYVDHNNTLYSIGFQSYSFHRFQPSTLGGGAVNTPPYNWDSTYGNIRNHRAAFLAVTQDLSVNVNSLAGHARVHLGI